MSLHNVNKWLAFKLGMLNLICIGCGLVLFGYFVLRIIWTFIFWIFVLIFVLVLLKIIYSYLFSRGN